MTRIVRKKEVSEALGISPSTLERKIKAGEFPLPLRLGENSVGWKSTTVDDYINSLQTAATVPCIPREVKRGRPRKQLTEQGV